MVVFDGIARPDHPHPLEPGNGREDRELNLFRQRGRDAVGIDRGVVEPFRLQEDLVAVAIAEPDDLVLDRGTIARTAALDLAGIHRRAMHVGPDHFMGRRRRPGDPALDLRRRDPVGHDRERLRRIVAGLHFDRRPVDGRAIEPRRRAGLQSSERKADPFERGRKPHCRRLPDPSGRPVLLAEMDQASQEGPGGDDHGAGGQLTAIAQTNSGDPAIRDDQLIRLAFDHAEIGGLPDRGLHGGGVKLAVRLGARSADRRTLAAVQHPKLDPAGIGDPAHQTVQGIDLADQMTLAETADGGIAGHRSDGRETMGHQGRLGAHPRSRARGFAAGVAAADDDDVERVRSGKHAGLLSRSCWTRKQKFEESVSRETLVPPRPMFHVKHG